MSDLASAARVRPGVRWAMVSAASVIAASVAGKLAVGTSIHGWYRVIAKPPYTPPDWVFPVAWTTLFVLMGIAFWRILRLPVTTAKRRTGIVLFATQLVFNAGWSAAFFGANSPLLGLVVVVPLWCLVLATALVFGTMDRIAGALLVPYLGWVAFATLLTFAIWRLN